MKNIPSTANQGSRGRVPLRGVGQRPTKKGYKKTEEKGYKKTEEEEKREIIEEKKRKRPPPVFSSVTRERKERAETAGSGERTQAELSTYVRTQAADAFEAVPGLFISQHGGRGKAHQFFLRGFDAVHGSELEIRVQGIPINEVSNIHGQGYADIGFLLPSSILRLRYRKGSFEGDQGDFAATGSLDIDLGVVERGLTISGGVGSFWRRELELVWAPAAMEEESFVSAQFSQSDGYGVNRGWLEGRGMAQGSFRWGAWKLRLMAGGSVGQYGSAGVLRESDVTTGRRDFYDAQREGLGGYASRFLGQATLSWRGEDQEAVFMLYAMGRDLRLKENFTGYLSDPRGDTFEQNHRFMQIGGEARWSRAWFLWGRRHELRGGLFFRYDQLEQAEHRLTDTDTRHTTLLEADAQVGQVAAWGGVSMHLLPWLRWQASLRGTILGMQVEDLLALRPRPPTRTGVGFQLAPRSILRFALAKGWEMSLAYGMGFRSTSARSLRDGERVPFQELHNAELGLRVKIPRWLTLSVAGFATYLAQELVFDHGAATNLYAGASWRGGAELDLRLWLGLKDLFFESSLSYSEGTLLATGEPVPYAPRLLWRGGLTYRWQDPTGFWKLMGALRWTFLGERPLPFGFVSEPIFLLHATAQINAGVFFLRLDGNNLLNAPWKDGQFVYSSSFDRGAAVQRLPQLHFTAGMPLQIFATLGITL